MGSFHDPPAGTLPCFGPEFFGFFSAGANMRRETKFAERIAHFLVIIAFIQTHALRLFSSRLGTVNHHALNRFSHQFHVVAMGSFNR